jgi:hypothetical protein
MAREVAATPLQTYLFFFMPMDRKEKISISVKCWPDKLSAQSWRIFALTNSEKLFLIESK